MFPLKIANNYQQPSSSIWQPLLETLRERKHVHCFEYMGGMHPENLQVAQDFWEEHYDTDGYKIFNIGLEPWFQQLTQLASDNFLLAVQYNCSQA